MFKFIVLFLRLVSLAFAEGDYKAGKYSSGPELASAERQAASNLAPTDLGAAATVQAALVENQVIVQALNRQLDDAQSQLQAEMGQYEQTHQAAVAAAEAMSQAQATLNAVTVAEAAAQAAATQAAFAYSEAVDVDAAQYQMIAEARHHVSQLSLELQSALTQLGETEAAAEKAFFAAQIAQSNATAAGRIGN